MPIHTNSDEDYFHQSHQDNWQISQTTRFCVWQLILLLIIQLRVCSHPQCLLFGTHTGVLLEFVQEVLGRNKVVQEIPKTVVLIGRLQDWKDLDKHARKWQKTLELMQYLRWLDAKTSHATAVWSKRFSFRISASHELRAAFVSSKSLCIFECIRWILKGA